MKNSSHKSSINIPHWTLGLLMLFFFCAPAYASDAPVNPTFRSTSPFGINQTIQHTTVNINGIHQGTIYKPFSSDHPFAELDPSSDSGGGSSNGNDDDDIGIGGWVDTPSEPLPIGDTLPLFLFAAAMIAIIWIKQRKQQLQSITTANNNNNTTQMPTRKQTYQSLRQKLFLLLAFVCAAGQVSADKTIYFRPGTTNFSYGYDVNDKKNYESAFWMKNGYIAMAIHNPSTANTQYIETGRHRSRILDTDVSKRFLSMVVPEGYTQIAAYRLKDITTDDQYTSWRKSPDNSKISNRIPVKNTSPNFIDIPTDGKNLLVHYEGYWNKWYWAYYLPTNNDVFIYFANTGNWSNVKMLTGKDIYTFPTAEFSTIEGTKLLYLSLTGNEYGYTNYGFINSSNDNLSKGWNFGLIPPICSSYENNDYHAFNGNRNDSNGDEGVTANQTYNKNNANATKKLYDIKVNKLSENLIANRIKNAPNYTGLREDLLEGINLFTPSSTNGSAVAKTPINSWEALNHTHTVTIEPGGKLNYGAYQLSAATTSEKSTGLFKTSTVTFTAAYTGTIILRAIPDEGYVFLGFYDQESNKLLSRGTEEEFTYNKITYPITYNYTYDAPNSSQKIIAKFAKGNTTRNFLVRTMIYDNGLKNSLDGGTFTITHSGGNTYTYTTQAEGTDYQEMYVSDAPMTLTANPKSGYEFIAWFNMDHDKRYPENPWTIDDPMNTTKYKQKFTAVFASTDYAKRQNINIKGPGYVDINYVFYEDGTSKTNTFYKNYSFIAWKDKDVTLTATPTPGYSFVGWYEGQNLVSKDATYTYTATSNRNITAHFAEGEETTTLRVRAMVWKDGQIVYGETGGTFTLTHSGGVVHQHQQQQKIDDYEHVVITNSPVTFNATINDGYEFIGWFNVKPDRRFLVNPWIMEDPLNISHDDNATTRYIDRFTAVFASTDYAKKQNIKFEGLGTVTANYTYYQTSTKEVVYEYNSSFIAWNGSDVTLTATPLEGYEFDGWYNSAGNKVSSDATHEYTVSEATTLTAKFKQKVHKLSVSVLNYNPEYDKFEEYGYEYNTVTLTQGSTKLKESYSSFEHTFNDETTVTLTATPEDGEDGYDFVGWFINNEKLTKEGSDKSDLYTLTSDYSNEITINLSGEVAVNAHFAPKKCWEVIIRNNIGGLFTVQYSRDANFTTYQTAESALDHYTYTHFSFGTTYVKVSPQPIHGYKLLGFKVGGIYSQPEKNNIVTYAPQYNEGDSKKSQVMTNFVREDEQIVYLNLKGSDGNIPTEWTTNDLDQYAYYAFVDNSFYNAKTPQLDWIKMTHVQDDCYTCTIPGNMYNRISFVQIGKDSEGYFVTKKKGDLTRDRVIINFDTIQHLGLNYVRDTLKLENRRTSLTAIPATRNNCYRLNWSWNSSKQTNDHGWTEPPTEVGDFRLVYIEQTVINKTTIREDYRFDNAGLIKKAPNTEDIISLHIYNKVSDGVNGVNNPEIILQKCTAIVDGKSQWEDIERHMVFGPLRTDDTGNIRLPGRKNSAGLIIDKGIDKIKDAVNDEDQASGVWNFVIVQDGEGGATLDLTRTAQYEGEYYIRTTNAKGQYNDYTNPDNVMTLSKYAKDNSDYSHYFIRYVDINEDGTPTSEAGKHQLVKFAIANKHSVYLNNELMVNNDRFKDDEYESDIFVRNIGGAPNLPADATVRFGWDIRTNRLTRAYIANTTIKNNEYLVVEGDKIGSPSGDATYFTDNSNWLYSIDLPDATAGAAAKVKAKMNGQYQYFMGSGSQDGYETLISGNGAGTYPIRLLYDFKDDRFTTIYHPESGTINNDVELSTPLMIERVHNDKATQIQLETNKKITTVQAGEDQYTQPAYAVMTFLESVLADASKTHHEKMFYWISFPFNVRIKDVFGLGDYGKYWIMEEYNGKQRAASGLAQNNWKYITKKSHILKKDTGYVLCLNYSQILQDQLFKSYGGSDEKLNSGKLSLYFPSYNMISPAAIKGGQERTVTLEQYEDANTAWNHHNWHIIGVPSFADPKFVDLQGDIPFVYQYWHPDDAYAAKAYTEITFQAMHAYMVQYHGKIKWQSIVNTSDGNVQPKALAAKTDEQADKKIMLRLELQQAGSTIDKTYVQLRNDKGTKGFDMSLDLTKIINAGANIYSIVDNHEMAGNAIPKDETVLPLGVVITAAGSYTFAMPKGTEGMIVELIDYEQGTSTNLLVSDYTITLSKGTFNQRFALRLKPDKVATSVDNIGNGANGDEVRKLLIDGVLYLQQGNNTYDAQGKHVQ